MAARSRGCPSGDSLKAGHTGVTGCAQAPSVLQAEAPQALAPRSSLGRASVCLAPLLVLGAPTQPPHVVGTWSHVVCTLRGGHAPCPACLPSLAYSGAEADGCRVSCGFAWMVPRTVTNHSSRSRLSPACG